jgi:hypothetical protein
MRRKIRLGRYILLLLVVVTVLFMARGTLKSSARSEKRPELPETPEASSVPSGSILDEFPRVWVKAREIRGDTLFFKDGRVALLGGGNPRVALAILDTLLALGSDFDTIDLRIKGHAVIR